MFCVWGGGGGRIAGEFGELSAIRQTKGHSNGIYWLMYSFVKLFSPVLIQTFPAYGRIAQKFCGFGESFVICQTKTIQICTYIVTNLLTDLFIHQNFLRQTLEKNPPNTPPTKLSRYSIARKFGGGGGGGGSLANRP